MVVSCSAVNCTNRWGEIKEDGRKLQFHKFPLKKPVLLKKWIIAMKRSSWVPSSVSVLCGKHFRKEDYRSDSQRYLKDDAVPTIFSFPEHLQKVEKKRRIISRHHNPEEHEKWSKAVQRTDKEMRLGDKVCELHFTEDEIIKDYETLLPDGTVWRMPKGRWSLKKGAVPTIFPNNQDTWRKRKAETISNNTDKKSKHLKTYGKENSEYTEIASNQSPTCSVTTVETPSPEYVEMVVDENTQQTEVVFKYLTEPLSYSALVNNLELLWKPSSLWGISVHDGFVVCAKWNEEGVLMKNIVIDCDLRIKVFFKNKAIETGHVKINNLSGLTALLKDIDRCGVCVNVNDMEKRNCDGYVFPHSQSNLCNYCRLIGNWEIDKKRLSKFFWLSKRQNFMKLETLYDKIHTLNVNNKLLKEQLHKMLKIKAVWKLSEQTNQTQAER